MVNHLQALVGLNGNCKNTGSEMGVPYTCYKQHGKVSGILIGTALQFVQSVMDEDILQDICPIALLNFVFMVIEMHE